MSDSAWLPPLPPIDEAERTAAIWVPDWPVVAAMLASDISPHLPAAVMVQNRVVAASAVARASGVKRGMRKRTAQGFCPSLVLLKADEDRDAMYFEPVALAAEQIASDIEVVRPGLALIPADGAARYYGSEIALVEHLVESISQAGFEGQVGIADGVLAAVLAARSDLIIPHGEAPLYLHAKPITELLNLAVGSAALTEVTELLSLLVRLGISTLGGLADLPGESVAARFGPLGIWAQRLAKGQDLRSASKLRPDQAIAVTREFDPPLTQVEGAVLVGKELANNFVELMLHRSLACGRIRITAVTTNGSLSRVWRTDDGAIGGMPAAAIAQRLRWQLESWLTPTSRPIRGSIHAESGALPDFDDVSIDEEGDAPSAIHSLEISAEEVEPASAYQSELWGGATGQDMRAARAIGNVQGLLGLDQVQAVCLRGERTPWARAVAFVFGEAPLDTSTIAQPWPGSVPDPAPFSLKSTPVPAELQGAEGQTVRLDFRVSLLDQIPSNLILAGVSYRVVNWAGPWLVPQNWWENPSEPTPEAEAFLQVVVDTGQAYLLQLEAGGWQVVGHYD